MPVKVTLEASRVQRFLGANTGAGPGAALLRRKAERVAALARVYAAGHGTIPEGIVVGPPSGGQISVISTNPNSQFVHDGTRRHFIRPKSSDPRARLRFTVGGRVVYARVVNHPGYRGDPFLTKALRDAI